MHYERLNVEHMKDGGLPAWYTLQQVKFGTEDYFHLLTPVFYPKIRGGTIPGGFLACKEDRLY